MIVGYKWLMTTRPVSLSACSGLPYIFLSIASCTPHTSQCHLNSPTPLLSTWPAHEWSSFLLRAGKILPRYRSVRSWQCLILLPLSEQRKTEALLFRSWLIFPTGTNRTWRRYRSRNLRKPFTRSLNVMLTVNTSLKTVFTCTKFISDLHYPQADMLHGDCFSVSVCFVLLYMKYSRENALWRYISIYSFPDNKRKIRKYVLAVQIGLNHYLCPAKLDWNWIVMYEPEPNQ